MMSLKLSVNREIKAIYCSKKIKITDLDLHPTVFYITEPVEASPTYVSNTFVLISSVYYCSVLLLGRWWIWHAARFLPVFILSQVLTVRAHLVWLQSWCFTVRVWSCCNGLHSANWVWGTPLRVGWHHFVVWFCGFWNHQNVHFSNFD